MDPGTLPQWGALVLALTSLAISIISSRSARNDKKLEALDAQDAVLEARLTRVEADMRHMPDLDTVHRMEMAISRIEGKFDVLDERLRPIAHQASRIQDAMLQRTDK